MAGSAVAATDAPPRRADARRNVRRILDTATETLASDPAASMADIATAAGLVRATLYRHFPSRDDLLRAILRDGLASASQAIVGADLERGPPCAAIRRLIAALLDVGSRYRILVELQVADPEAELQAETVGAPIVAAIERGQRSGALRCDLPARWLAAALGSLVVEALRAIARGDLTDVTAAQAVADTFLQGSEVG